jgi:uncharacterized protein
MERHQLVLDVTELLAHAGTHLELAFSEPVPDLATELVRVTEPVDFNLVLESMTEGILVRGRLKGGYVASCRRCLEENARGFEVEVAELYVKSAAEDPDNEFVIEGTTIDLDPLAHDSIGLELPMFPLCQPDCQGICPTCGTNRNTGECTCPDEETDERWGALRALLDQAGEEH